MKAALLWALLSACAAYAGNDPFEDHLNQLRGLLAGFKGTTVRAVGNAVIIEGELDDPGEVERLHTVVAAVQPVAHLETKMSVQSVVTVSKAGRDRITDDIRRDIGAPAIQLRWVRDTLLLEGNADTDFDADRAVELVKVGLGIGSDNGAWRKTKLVDMLRVKSGSGLRAAAKTAPRAAKAVRAPKAPAAKKP